MLPILYSYYNCPHSLKAAFFLSEKGIDFQRVEVDLSNQQQKTSTYLAINPKGTVPAFEDADGTLGDSLDIMKHADQYAPPRLIPEAPQQLDDALKWIARADQEFWHVSHHLYWQLIEPAASGTDWNDVRQLKAQGVSLLQELDDRLQHQRYVCGELSIVDVVLLPWVYGYQRFDLAENGQFPHVERWRDELAQRASFIANYRQRGIPLEDFLATR
ncbi:MAG: glutathione S-transferase family protein [Anaerolineae bacterium]